MTAPKNSSRRRPTSTHERRLADELHTHQVELEMQNQELVRTKNDLELSRARYFELYDFAPVPYFTLRPLGLVDSLNLAAAELFQLDRQRAIGSSLSPFLEEASRGKFRAHVETVFEMPGRHTIDLVLAPRRDAPRRHLHLVSRLIRGEMGATPLCLTTALDITERKTAEEEITRMNGILEQRVAQRTRRRLRCEEVREVRLAAVGFQTLLDAVEGTVLERADRGVRVAVLHEARVSDRWELDPHDDQSCENEPDHDDRRDPPLPAGPSLLVLEDQRLVQFRRVLSTPTATRISASQPAIPL